MGTPHLEPQNLTSDCSKWLLTISCSDLYNRWVSMGFNEVQGEGAGSEISTGPWTNASGNLVGPVENLV